MNKFKNATKKITAVAASAVMVSSAAFAAGLGDYPNNFVSGGEFDGQVVVGAAAQPVDTTSAMSIIDDLAAQFSGDSTQVRITYKKVGSGGDSEDVIKSNAQLNYGENLGDSDVTEAMDDGDFDFLADNRFENGNSDEDYTQEITLSNGAFNYALRDNVDGVSEISNNIYYDSGDTYLTYTLELDNAIDVSGYSTQADLDADFVGEVIEIMGNEFTIGSITESSGNVTKLELLGGANKVSLGEGESTTVSVDGKSYEVSIQSVSDEKVLLTVNGESVSIDEFETEDVGGVSVAVTDLVSSSRDAVKGYAEIVVGGQKITLEDSGEVQVNDDDVSDLYDGYLVESTIATGGLNTITIVYKVDDDVSLEAGDSLIDPLFGGFELTFEGVNNVDYETVEVRSSDDDVVITGDLISGDEFDRAFVHTTYHNGNVTGDTYLRGVQDGDRIFFSGSDMTTATPITGITLNASDAVIDYTSTGIKGSGFFLYDDEESQYLYEIASVDTTDGEVDFDEVVDGKDKAGLTAEDTLTDLEINLAGSSNASTSLNLKLTDLGDTLAFANERMMDFSSVETAGAIPSGTLDFTLDGGDVDSDEAADEAVTVTVTLDWDGGSDDEFEVVPTASGGAGFVNSGLADNEDGNNDVQTFVTAYGTMVEYDNDESSYVKIMTPDEQVYAKVSLVTGGGSSSEMTVTVDADMAEDKKDELIDDGYTIVDEEEVSSEEVEFDVSAPVMDSDVSGTEDMIVVGGPAVNRVAAELLGLSFPTYGSASGVNEGEAVIRYFSDSNSVLVYGYEGADTAAAAEKLNEGGLSGNSVDVQ